MIEDKELGVKVAENFEEKTLYMMLDNLKKKIEATEFDLKHNKTLIEFELKQLKEREKFVNGLMRNI